MWPRELAALLLDTLGVLYLGMAVVPLLHQARTATVACPQGNHACQWSSSQVILHVLPAHAVLPVQAVVSAGNHTAGLPCQATGIHRPCRFPDFLPHQLLLSSKCTAWAVQDL